MSLLHRNEVTVLDGWCPCTQEADCWGIIMIGGVHCVTSVASPRQCRELHVIINKPCVIVPPFSPGQAMQSAGLSRVVAITTTAPHKGIWFDKYQAFILNLILVCNKPDFRTVANEFEVLELRVFRMLRRLNSRMHNSNQGEIYIYIYISTHNRKSQRIGNKNMFLCAGYQTFLVTGPNRLMH